MGSVQTEASTANLATPALPCTSWLKLYITPRRSRCFVIFTGHVGTANVGRPSVSVMERFGRRRRRPTVAATPQSDPTLPVMWPEPGSGFEADPFSPAGMSQQVWRATTGRRPHSRPGLWIVRIICIVVALAFIAAQVAH